MRILIVGKYGQVAWEARRSLAVLGDVIALGHVEMDLEDPDLIRMRVREIGPSVIVNAGAHTAVDLAEKQSEKAHRINGVAPGILAEEAKRLGADLIHYSTDYVFDGTKAEPHREDDEPNPMSAYGRSKFAGEQAIQAVGGCFLIFRINRVYASRGKNFLLTILSLAREHEVLRMVDDPRGAPTTARVIADATAQVLGSRKGTREWPSGIYNLACGGSTTWFGFASKILTAWANQLGDRRPAVTPIATEQYPTPATRPPTRFLDGSGLRRTFGRDRTREWVLICRGFPFNILVFPHVPPFPPRC